ncbi:hypothetical protein KC338_g46 [Hortaea werneckii]|nr:hypothetical protein KC338_g46 [Hortaea werneckii]
MLAVKLIKLQRTNQNSKSYPLSADVQMYSPLVPNQIQKPQRKHYNPHTLLPTNSTSPPASPPASLALYCCAHSNSFHWHTTRVLTLAQQLRDIAKAPDALVADDRVRDIAPGGLVAADLALGVAVAAIARAPGRGLVDGLEGAVRLVEGLAVRVVQLVLVQQLLALVVLEVLEEDAVFVLVLPFLLLRIPLPGLQLRRHVGGDLYGPVSALEWRGESDGSRQDERQDGEDHLAKVLHVGSYLKVLDLVRSVVVESVVVKSKMEIVAWREYGRAYIYRLSSMNDSFSLVVRYTVPSLLMHLSFQSTSPYRKGAKLLKPKFHIGRMFQPRTTASGTWSAPQDISPEPGPRNSGLAVPSSPVPDHGPSGPALNPCRVVFYKNSAVEECQERELTRRRQERNPLQLHSFRSLTECG